MRTKFVILATALALGAPASGPSLAASSPPRCTAANLKVSAINTTGATGHLLGEFAFTNKGSATCTLFGYPRLRMLNSSGHPIPTTYQHTPAGFAGIPQHVVTLATGKRAFFGVFYADQTGFGDLSCPTSSRLRFRTTITSPPLMLTGAGAHISPYGGTTTHLHCGIVQLTPVTGTKFQ